MDQGRGIEIKKVTGIRSPAQLLGQLLTVETESRNKNRKHILQDNSISKFTRARARAKFKATKARG